MLAALTAAAGCAAAPVHDLPCCQALQFRVHAKINVYRPLPIHVKRQLCAEWKPQRVKVASYPVQQAAHVSTPEAMWRKVVRFQAKPVDTLQAYPLLVGAVPRLPPDGTVTNV